MTAEEYLDEIKKIDAVISNKRKEYRRWVEVAAGLSYLSGAERVQSSRYPQKDQNAIVSYVNLEREIDELLAKRQAIIKNIERLPSEEYKVIYKLYVDIKDNGEGYTLKEVAYLFHRSYEWAKKKKQRGLRLVQGFLNDGI